MGTIKDSEELGRLIRQERKAQGLTQMELAALTGVGLRFLRELELGKESCRLGLAFKVMASLGLACEIRSRTERRT